MSEVRDKVLDAVRLLKKERIGACTHIVTWGFTGKSNLPYEGEFAYCYEDQVNLVFDILKQYEEIEGIFASRITLEKQLREGVVEAV